ncbi:MAG: hypothetical protein CSA75_01500 [Sorangium cellulosum]|nr:MAG: hypothetical protein CSA75_01500 [Sorangium cellulosum]
MVVAAILLTACTKDSTEARALGQSEAEKSKGEVASMASPQAELDHANKENRSRATPRPRKPTSGKGLGGAFSGDNVLKPTRPRAGGDRAGYVEQGKETTTNAPLEEVIDPNGRFATTYRPGGGHLAAFESAVGRGVIPEAEREIVSDIGARYWTPMDEPKGKSLALRTDFERSALPPSGGDVHMRVSLRSTKKPPAGRPHLSVHLVLDVSGSMQGAPMDQAKLAAQALVDKLAATDDFSLVTFSSDAEVRVQDVQVAQGKAHIKQAIEKIKAGGGTNIGGGLQLAYEQAKSRSVPADAVRVVLLLSDGRANSGITNSSRLSRLALEAFQDGIQTSTFGLGSGYDGALMSSIASDGAGGYYFLRDAEQIAPALSTELDKRLDPAATAVEVRIRLNKDVQLLRIYGSRRLNAAEAARVRAIEVAADEHAAVRDKIKKDRQDDTKGGMRFLIPAFARDDNHVMLFKVRVPAGVGKKEIASIELKYKDRVSKRNVTDEARIRINFANSDAESANSTKPTVARTVQGFAAGETLMEASRWVANGNKGRALALLIEREEILRRAADTLEEPGFKRDADRLARLRTHLGASDGMSEPLLLAMLLETAGRTHLH